MFATYWRKSMGLEKRVAIEWVLFVYIYGNLGQVLLLLLSFTKKLSCDINLIFLTRYIILCSLALVVSNIVFKASKCSKKEKNSEIPRQGN